MSEGQIQIEELSPTSQEGLEAIGRFRLEVWRQETGVNESLFPSGVWLEPIDQGARHWVARDPEGMVASARLSVHDKLLENPDGYLFERAKIEVPLPAAHLCKLVVHERARGKGLATQLNKIRIEAAKRMVAKSILVTASEANSRLLHRLGFLDDGIRETFKNRPGLSLEPCVWNYS